MSGSTTASAGVGGGFFGLLTIAFIVLKLTGVINWSWWWVLSPLLFSWALGLILIVIVLLVTAWVKKTPAGAVRSYGRSVSGTSRRTR